MTISAVAFVPAAPLLVPQLAGGSAHLDDDLRAASLSAVAELISGTPTIVVVAAPTDAPGDWGGEATWAFAGFGVRDEGPDRHPALPWSLGVGAWLLDECGYGGLRRYIGVPPDWDGTVAALPDGAVVLAVGDGSACRTEKAPGHLDPRAQAFDDATARVLSEGDAAGLTAIDGALGRELMCGGVPVWRWVASASGGAPVSRSTLTSHVAPYGVAYFVASWSFD